MANMSTRRSSSVGRNSLIANIHDISTVFISCSVVHNLGSAIRQSYSVGSGGRVSIPLLLLVKPSSGVIISYSVLVGIVGRCIIAGLFVARSTLRGSQGSRDKGRCKDESL